MIQVSKWWFVVLALAGFACAEDPPRQPVPTMSVCGDGKVESSEGCDDGNIVADDGCSEACQVEEGWDCSADTCRVVCGDGKKLGTETCDDGNAGAGDGCSTTCTVEDRFQCDGVGPGSCRCLAQFAGASCDECSDPHRAKPACTICLPQFTGANCNRCADARFTGVECDQCTDPHFALPACTTCLPMYVGANCDQCADPHFAAPDCTTCLPQFTGANCDQCADPHFAAPDCTMCLSAFTGANCDECADARFTGLNCDQCSDARFTGSNCDQCSDARFSGANCDQTTCATSEAYADTCWPILSTNISACYNRLNAISCPGTAGSASCGTTSYCGQDAQYPDPNAQNLVCVDAGGQDLASCPITATSGETVRDGLTGLIWQRADMPPGHNWQWVTDYCAALSYGGQSDWRLPTAHELRSILDYSRTDPAIDEAVFPTYNSGSSPTANFWSSSSTTANTNLAWFVGFQEGSTGDDDKNNNYHIRCVRSPSGGSISPPNRFTQNTTQGEVVVIDSLTGLMWQHTTVSAITWQEALAYCETLSYAGSDDWRLPNVNSLASMVDYARASPASDFPNMPNQYFWSSSTSARTTSWGMNVAWYVDFDSGDVSSNFKSRNYDVRCVR